jgi:hypothetical protein
MIDDDAKVNFVGSGSRSGSGGRAYDALLLDAGGTLLQLANPVEETYAAIGSKYGWLLSSLISLIRLYHHLCVKVLFIYNIRKLNLYYLAIFLFLFYEKHLR